MQEMANLRSPRSVTQFLDTLERGGYIKRLPGARNIRVLRHPQMDSSADRADVLLVPVIGQVAAGSPIFADENIEDYIHVSRNLARGSARYFALRVRGDSMDAVAIKDGDIVLVRAQAIADPGERVIALIGDDATVKVFRPGPDAIVLEPRSTNRSHRPIVVERDFRIQGVVVANLGPAPRTSE